MNCHAQKIVKSKTIRLASAKTPEKEVHSQNRFIKRLGSGFEETWSFQQAWGLGGHAVSNFISLLSLPLPAAMDHAGEDAGDPGHLVEG